MARPPSLGAFLRGIAPVPTFAAYVLAVALLVAAPAAAQVPDTTAAVQVPDTTAAERVIRTDVRPMGFGRPVRGVVLSDTLPALLPALEVTELMAQVPGSFTYLFGTAGWPEGWSIWGLPPHAATLLFDDIPFTHVFTGRPAYGLIPIAFVEVPRLEVNRLGRPAAVLANMRPFASPNPLTEGRYWKGGDGLQSIDVVHVQNRRRTLFGRPGLLNVLGAYSGRAATGEYSGSALRRGRQLHVRGRFEQPKWSLEIFNAHNRRRVGAHGGVIPDGNFESIYFRTGARVEHPDAERRTVRNDLSTTLRLRVLNAPSSVSAYWTAETFRYRDESDTLVTESDRLGLHARQPLFHGPSHRIAAHLEAWTDRVTLAGRRHSRSALHAYARDSLGVFGWSGALTAGVHLYDGGIHPGASIGFSRGTGRVSVSVNAALTGAPAGTINRTGFGSLAGLADAASGRVVLAQAALGYGGGAVDGHLGVFFTRSSDPVDYYVVGGDSAAVLNASSAFTRTGVYADLGWRREAERGFYLTLKPSLVRFLNPDESPLHRRVSDALPYAFGRGRLGMRYLLFQGDLDMDAYVEALAWSSFRSRTLHAPSGLLAVPAEGARLFGPSSMINFVLEAGIREATLFIMYENALSGTALLTGNLIVPNYPLPARRFRLGVYWPIFD